VECCISRFWTTVHWFVFRSICRRLWEEKRFKPIFGTSICCMELAIYLKHSSRVLHGRSWSSECNLHKKAGANPTYWVGMSCRLQINKLNNEWREVGQKRLYDIWSTICLTLRILRRFIFKNLDITYYISIYNHDDC
jgi:hypothetical protein